MNYLELMEKADKAIDVATSFYRKHDIKMATFWKNVSDGYKQKALALYIWGEDDREK